MEKLKFQVVSDLHLEFRTSFENLIIPSAPILLLCGDVMVCSDAEEFKIFTSFIDYIYKSFACIIHVPGNHEFYSKNKASTYQSINAKLKAFSKTKKKYHYLNNATYKFKFNKQKFVIAGTTLWTNITGGGDAEVIKDHMNDYNFIYFQEKKNQPSHKLRVIDMVGIHMEAVNFIKKTIASCRRTGSKCIMITHHKPYVSHIRKVILGYESDMTAYMGDPIILWCHGHIHEVKRAKINNTIITSNPLGYPNQNTGYKPNYCVSFSL